MNANPTPTQPETLEPPEVIHVTFCSKCGRTGLHNTRCSKCGNKLGFEDEIAYLRQLEQLSPELVERVANYLEGNRHDNPLVLAHALRRAAVTAPRGDVAQRRLEIALGYIKRAANRELPKLPCRVDEMTEREVAIFNVGAAAVGNLQFIARELDALPAAATSSPTPAESAPWSPNAAIELLEKWLQDSEVEHDEGLERLLRAINQNSLSDHAFQPPDICTEHEECRAAQTPSV